MGFPVREGHDNLSPAYEGGFCETSLYIKRTFCKPGFVIYAKSLSTFLQVGRIIFDNSSHLPMQKRRAERKYAGETITPALPAYSKTNDISNFLAWRRYGASFYYRGNAESVFEVT